MRNRLQHFLLLALVLAALPSHGLSRQCNPPPNETCETAIPFTNSDLPFEVTAPLGCVNDEIDKPYFDVFYRFDCAQTGTYLIEMCGSEGDTYLRVYANGCGWANGIELAVADDECPGSPPNADPMLSVQLQANQSYWIEVGTWRPDPPWAPPPNSPYTLRVSFLGTPSVPALPGASVLALALMLGSLAALRLASKGRTLA